jgi:predicted SnoaL-like aldol condensation-catalyzing enzyme
MKIPVPVRLAGLAAAVLLVLSGSPDIAVANNGDVQSVDAAFGGDQNSKDCNRGRHDLERNKHNAVAFYTLSFNEKKPRLAVQLYGGNEYIQHNPLAANGFDAFIQFVEGFAASFPNLHIDIRRVFAECDFVITHSIVSGADPVFTPLGSKVVDIFRLDSRGKIVEHWDVLAAISPTSANGNPEV